RGTADGRECKQLVVDVLGVELIGAGVGDQELSPFFVYRYKAGFWALYPFNEKPFWAKADKGLRCFFCILVRKR
ncbi:hypothetical protein JYB64_26150, partial [Algoriphagus aestuarii]|nr:hypothetical protein [Algoriphagus aestuarii]